MTDVNYYVAILMLVCVTGCQPLTCHVCTKSKANEDCINAVETCNNTEDVCITRIEKYIFKYYTKGCMDKTRCEFKASIGNARYCHNTPSDCSYCCSDRDRCNANNGGFKQPGASSILHVFMLSTLLFRTLHRNWT